MTIDTKRLRELCDAATPGPWETAESCEDGALPGEARVCYVRDGESCEWCIALAGETERDQWTRETTERWRSDATFISSARTALPELLDENERLRAALDYLRRKIDDYDTTFHFAVRDTRGENPIPGFEDWEADE